MTEASALSFLERGGFTIVDNRQLAAAMTLPGTALKVWLGLVARARMRWPEAGVRSLAGLLGVSERSVERALKVLAERGMAERGQYGWRALLPDSADGTSDKPVGSGDKSVAIETTGKEGRKEKTSSLKTQKTEEKEGKNPPPHPSQTPTEEEEKAPSENPTSEPHASPEGENPFTSEREAPDNPSPPKEASSDAQTQNPACETAHTTSWPQAWRRLGERLRAEGLWGEAWRAVFGRLQGGVFYRFAREASQLFLEDPEAFVEGVRRALNGIGEGGVKQPGQYLLAVVRDPQGRWRPAWTARRRVEEARLEEAKQRLASLAHHERLRLVGGKEAIFGGFTGPGGRNAILVVDGVARIVAVEDALAQVEEEYVLL